MFSNKLITFFLILLFVPIHSNAFFGIIKRFDQKQKISAAREAYAKGNYEETIKICQEFLMQNQEAPKRRTRRIYTVLGDAYAALGDYDHALLTYNEALEVLPKDISLNLSLADLYYKTELYDKAIEFYNKTLQLSKNNSKALLGLARSYLKTGFLSKSRQYFKDYLELNNNISADIYYDYATANFLSNNLNNALEYAKKAKDLNPDADTYFLIAKIYNAFNDTAQAEENIKTALNLSQNREDIFLTNLLWESYKQNSAADALTKIKNFQKENPSSQLAVFIEGNALLTQGKKQKAFNVFKKIENQNKDSFIKEVAKQILKNN